MKNTSYNPTMIIKSTFSNDVHKILEPNINVKKSERWKNGIKYVLTNEQKIELFDKIKSLHFKSSKELTAYQFDRREKKRIHKSRVERGYFEKKSEKTLDNK